LTRGPTAPSVSVIVPTFRRPGLLVEALRSLQAQDLTDWEALVIDDGSSDATRALAEGFADPRIRYLEQAHAGRSIARNRGLTSARGSYIALLDDDDLYLPGKLALEATFLQAHSAVDLVGTGVSVEGALGPVGTWEPWRSRSAPSLLGLLLDGNGFLTCSVLFRRQVLNRMDHWFDPELEWAEDADFFLRMAAAGAHMVWLHHVTAVYRLRRRPLNCLLTQRAAYRRVLEKLLARADAPPHVRERRSTILSRFHLMSACRWYALGQVSAAQRDLLHALLLLPGLGRAGADATNFLESVTRTAADPLWVSQTPRAYVDFVFDHLPSPLRGLESLRNCAHVACAAPSKINPQSGGAAP